MPDGDVAGTGLDLPGLRTVADQAAIFAARAQGRGTKRMLVKVLDVLALARAARALVNRLEEEERKDADDRRWHEIRAREHRSKREPALAAFDRWMRFLHVGRSTPAFDRVKEAMWDVGEWRRVSNTRGGDYEMQQLAVRVVADQLAADIEAATTDEQDPHTVSWVVAGLRCPRQPFCVGCPQCQTVTAPTRPNVEPKPVGMWR